MADSHWASSDTKLRVLEEAALGTGNLKPEAGRKEGEFDQQRIIA